MTNEALTYYFNRYWFFIVSLGFKLINSKEISEDVAADCFIKLADREFESEVKARGFLFTCFRNEIKNLKRNWVTRSTNHQKIYEDNIISGGAIFVPQEHELIKNEVVEMVWEQIKSNCSPRELEVMLYLYKDDLYMDEASVKMGISVFTVRVLYNRAIHKLKRINNLSQ